MILELLLFFLVPFYIFYKLYNYLTNKKIDPVGKTIFVTGACSGIGKSLVQNLLKQGCVVFGADIKLDEEMKDKNLHLIQMDVGDQKSIDEAVKFVSKITNGKIFAIINNAGIGFSRDQKYVKSIAEMDMDKEVLPVFNVNILGLMRVTTSFLTLLKNNKEENPCVVNIASVAGYTCAPFFGAYCLTKHAVVAYSECLRKEMFKLMRVICVEPHFVETPLVVEKIQSVEKNKDESIIGDLIEEDYDLMFNAIRKSPKLTPEEISLPIIGEIFSTKSKAHLPIIKNFRDKVLIYLYYLLPSDIYDPCFRFLAKWYGSRK